MAYVKKPYTRKIWVNVSDPSSLPDIPEGQDDLARFDEDNMNRIEDGIEEVINSVREHTHTASDIGLGNVDNTSDADKPVSTAQATAIKNAKKAGTDAQSNLNSHTSNKSNPHGVTISQLGAAPAYTYGTTDLIAGSSNLATGKLHFVYE